MLFKTWTWQRQTSFWFHSIVVAITLALSGASAAHFWYELFSSWIIAVLMVSLIDVLALAGLVLHILNVPSPFTTLRHVLPCVSVVPLGLEFWQWLSPHGNWISIPVASFTTTIVVVIAWKCYTTIEQLFVDPDVAASERIEREAKQTRQRMRRQVEALAVTLDELNDMSDMVSRALSDWSQQRIVVTAVDKEMSLLPEHTTNDDNTMPLIVTKRQMEQYAELRQCSPRTVQRHLDAGKLSRSDILKALEVQV